MRISSEAKRLERLMSSSEDVEDSEVTTDDLDIDDADDAAQKEREYQHRYYEEHKKQRSAQRKHRWRCDPEYRRRINERTRLRRAKARAETADQRFSEMVEAKKERTLARRKKGRKYSMPWRKVPVGEGGAGPFTRVYSAGYLALEVGRETATVREWLTSNVLPGCSIWIGDRAFFTREFIDSVYAACERLFYLDGRGLRSVLRRLINEELVRRKVPYRVEPEAAPVQAKEG